jgi:drug/metabolite transporter (DMT)-like permease
MHRMEKGRQRDKISPAMLFKTHRVTGNNAVSIKRKFPVRLAVGLLIAILIDTALQLVWKSAVLTLPHDGSPWLNVQAILQNPRFVFVIFLMGCQFFNWLMILGDADLSYAQPVTSLSYVSVFFLSVLYLKETADLFQIAGIMFVLVGVWFISQTEHLTQAQESDV